MEQSAPAAALTGKAGGLTSAQLAKNATATSPALLEKQRDVEAADADLDRAFVDYFPRLQVSNSITRYNDVPSTTLGPVEIDPVNTVKSLGASLTIPISDYLVRLGPAYDAASASVAAAHEGLHVEQRKTAYEARALYYAWVQAELEAAVAVQNLELGKEHLARVKSLAAADSASEADVASVEASVAGAELVVVQAQNLVALQRERIAIALHDAKQAASTYQIGEDFSATPADAEPIDDVERLVREALVKRPELAALRSQVAAYDEQADSARSGAFPRLNAVGNVGLNNPDQRRFPQEDEFHGAWSIGLSMTYSPNDTASYLARASSTEHKARALEAQQLALRDVVRAEVVDAALALRNATANIAISQRRLSAAETAYRARKERYLVDMATTVELSEAQTELFSARLDAVQAQVAVRAARAKLAYVSGQEQI